MEIFLYIVFTLVAVLLSAVILVQEGKGGGMGAAFGGVGGEAFGHGAGGINKFTSVLAGILLLTALVIAFIGNKSDTIIG